MSLNTECNELMRLLNRLNWETAPVNWNVLVREFDDQHKVASEYTSANRHSLTATVNELVEAGFASLDMDNDVPHIRYRPRWYLLRQIGVESERTKHGNVLYDYYLVDTNSRTYYCSPFPMSTGIPVGHSAGFAGVGQWEELSEDQTEEVVSELEEYEAEMAGETYYMSIAESEMHETLKRCGAQFDNADIKAMEEQGDWFDADGVVKFFRGDFEDFFYHKKGKEVFWHDPDGGACSRNCTVLELNLPSSVVTVTDGEVEWEVLYSELGNRMPDSF